MRRREELAIRNEEVGGLVEEGYRRPLRRAFEVSVWISRGVWEMGMKWGYILALYHRGGWEGPGLWGNPGAVKMGVWDEEKGF